MTDRDRVRIAFHGAVLLLVGLLCGVPAVTEPEGQPMPSWQAAHGGLMLTGVWLLAVSSVVTRLVLDRDRARALFFALIGGGYAFMTTVLVQAVTGVRGTSPGGSPANWIAFAANLSVAMGTVVGALLTVMGLHAALSADHARTGALVSGEPPR